MRSVQEREIVVFRYRKGLRIGLHLETAQSKARVETEKGRAFYSVLAAMWRFGEDWLWDEGDEPSLQLFDRETGDPVSPRVVNERTGVPIDVRQVQLGERRKGTR